MEIAGSTIADIHETSAADLLMGGDRCAVTPEDPSELPRAGERRWYVVYSKPRKETRAKFHLERRQVEVFYPQLRLPRYVTAPRQVVPLFPNYLFVRINIAEQFHDVTWSPGIRRFVGPLAEPTPLDDEVVVFLKRLASSEGVIAARPDLTVGQEVEITRGPFSGLLGIIQRPADARGRVKVLMQLLTRRAITVDIPVRLLRSGWLV
jgi:transcription elongation factor/antiterminator RfaH